MRREGTQMICEKCGGLLVSEYAGAEYEVGRGINIYLAKCLNCGARFGDGQFVANQRTCLEKKERNVELFLPKYLRDHKRVAPVSLVVKQQPYDIESE